MDMPQFNNPQEIDQFFASDSLQTALLHGIMEQFIAAIPTPEEEAIAELTEILQESIDKKAWITFIEMQRIDLAYQLRLQRAVFWAGVRAGMQMQQLAKPQPVDRAGSSQRLV